MHRSIFTPGARPQLPHHEKPLRPLRHVFRKDAGAFRIRVRTPIAHPSLRGLLTLQWRITWMSARRSPIHRCRRHEEFRPALSRFTMGARSPIRLTDPFTDCITRCTCSSAFLSPGSRDIKTLRHCEPAVSVTSAVCSLNAAAIFCLLKLSLELEPGTAWGRSRAIGDGFAGDGEVSSITRAGHPQDRSMPDTNTLINTVTDLCFLPGL